MTNDKKQQDVLAIEDGMMLDYLTNKRADSNRASANVMPSGGRPYRANICH